MLDLGRYLLGVGEIALLVGFAYLGASALRSRLVPEFSGTPAFLATSVLSLALLIWVAELLGTLGAFDPVPYLVAVGVVGVGSRTFFHGWRGGRGAENGPWPARRPPSPRDGTRGQGAGIATFIALVIAGAAVVHFGSDVRVKLGTGMTGFDSTWYHGTFAAGFMQSGDTWSLHHIAPQFLAWFYPANSELLHAIGMNAFGRDILSPLLNLGWFIGCLFACWCIGRPYMVAPWSLGFGAIALSIPALSDQAGEARNDIVGIFFLLAAAAVALNAWSARREGERPLSTGALILTGLAAGLAAGTKLNFLLPCAVLVIGMAAVAPRGWRWRSLAIGTLAALAGGGYWYLRNLLHTGNPLPWFDSLGPISLPSPDQALGGREAHSILSYLGDGAVWSDWYLPGLHHGVGLLWPLLGMLAIAGLVLSLTVGSSRALRVVSLAGCAALVAWLIAPTSASGPDRIPQGFESGLRYLAPALVLGLALLPTVPILRDRLVAIAKPRPVPRLKRFFPLSGGKGVSAQRWRSWGVGGGLVVFLLAVGLGYPTQRDYLRDRYANPTFTTPGLNAAFKWAGPVSGASIATTSTRQYPLFGTDLSNRVEFVGETRPHGGFVAPSTCRAWRRLLNEGEYDYVVASRDRIEPGKPPFPPTARWTEAPGATVILRKPPTVVFRIDGPLDTAGCPRRSTN